MDFRNGANIQSVASIIVLNGIDYEPVRTVLSRFGYPPERLEELAVLAEDAFTKKNDSDVAMVYQVDCTLRYKQAFTELKKSYRTHRKRAKILFENSSDILVQLGCTGRVGVSCAEIVASAELLYGGIGADATIQKALAVLDLGEREVAAARQLIAKVQQLRVESGKCKAETERARELKKQSHLACQRWITKFIKVARIAFADQPEGLVVLGIRYL